MSLKKRKTKTTASSRTTTGSVRIIAGLWRGRKLAVPKLPGLRPTPDRLRETLFNWLMPSLPGAVCLDAFAGSGALGLEAASRGAAQVTLIEQSPILAKQLQQHINHLNPANTTGRELFVHHQNALDYLNQKPATPFDLVFLDPPFHQQLLEKTCTLLEQGGWLKPQAQIYLEMEQELQAVLPTSWPDTWQLHREQSSREIYSCLIQRSTL